MIEFRQVTKTYAQGGGYVTALSGIDLHIDDGDIFGIIGLSGAGKSTLVRCINLLERPTSGSVIIDGEDLTTVSQKRLREVRRNIGMIFQSFNLLDQKTVFRNVAFPLELIHAPKTEIDKRVTELLEIVGLGDKANAYPTELSGGQKQRVAIARALATNPKYLLCDEATSALDPNTTNQILALLKSINETMGVTIVVITHEMRVIESICTRVAVIDKSVIAEEGDVAEIFANPKSGIARELIIPDLIRSIRTSDDSAKFRLIFNGETSYLPVISELTLECGIPVNILFADTKNIEGKAYGHMVVTVPDKKEITDKLKAYLTEKQVSFIKEDEE